ncbi:pentapeptide repeat-containing protein [Arthrobacter sp. PAMC25284]|uniref:pentapeptide repeat-containing protein n=1 Tax=Arthrobacter sp. PAMC25284 TaxID=2861279 RepID=UPI001C633F4A|nr:pentapeptide repeat-containing protein [Arthrobacter sp. PAMC25284]QYF89313.1 pentapeptide repeat-containing protein [Arthrobacter sp. PAMC25284]
MGRSSGAGRPQPAAPRLAPVRLAELRDDASPDFRRGERYDGVRYTRASADGLELSGMDFLECEFAGISFNETQLRGATFRDCVLAEVYAPVFTAARTVLRDVEVSNPRWGSAELYESGWQSVRIDGGKLDYLNLRGSTLTDVQISDCIINELDLGSCTATRVALKNCTIGTLDVSGAKLKDVDVRTTEFRVVSGLGSLAGLVIDDNQLTLLAPLLAAHLGVVVA